MHGFQNSFAQLLSSRRRSAVRNICSRRLKVKFTLEGQMIKWSQIELVRAITCTFMRCCAHNFREVEGANWFRPVRLSVDLPLPARPPKNVFFFFFFFFFFRFGCFVKNSLTLAPPSLPQIPPFFLILNLDS